MSNSATPHDYYMALAYSVRNELLKQRIHTAKTYSKQKAKVVYYLSAEFLMGRHLGNGLINLGLYETMRPMPWQDCNLDLDELLEREAEPGLGNGGLGPAGGLLYGFVDYPEHSSGGLRHSLRVWHLHPGHFGMATRSRFPIKWLTFCNPWEIARPDYRVGVKFGGYTQVFTKMSTATTGVRWIPEQVVMGVPHDVPVPGYGTENVNILRLWKAEASESFDLTAFNAGDYFGAVVDKMVSENITKVLYPPTTKPTRVRSCGCSSSNFFVACSPAGTLFVCTCGITTAWRVCQNLRQFS